MLPIWGLSEPPLTKLSKGLESILNFKSATKVLVIGPDVTCIFKISEEGITVPKIGQWMIMSKFDAMNQENTPKVVFCYLYKMNELSKHCNRAIEASCTNHFKHRRPTHCLMTCIACYVASWLGIERWGNIKISDIARAKFENSPLGPKN